MNQHIKTPKKYENCLVGYILGSKSLKGKYSASICITFHTLQSKPSLDPVSDLFETFVEFVALQFISRSRVNE